MLGLGRGEISFYYFIFHCCGENIRNVCVNVKDPQYELENFEEVLEFDNECCGVMASNGVALVTLICSIKISVSMTPRRAQYKRYR